MSRWDRPALAAMATETIRLLEEDDLFFEGDRISVAALLAEEKKQIRYFPYARLRGIWSTDKAKEAATGSQINVTTSSSLEAIARAAGTRTAVLNFASARKPGGGWRTGAVAQEESLCRASTLGLLLESDKAAPFYEEPPPIVYSHRVLLCPNVLFFRDDSGAITEPTTVAVLTCAAPNLSGEKPQGIDISKLLDVRARGILAIAWLLGYRRLILGAWGCGVFKNDPVLVARAFKKGLSEFPFAEVEFAILGPWAETHDIFSEVLLG